MWPLNLLRKRHWVLLGVSVLFLLTYSGFVSWGKVGQALEYLADQPAVRQRFAPPIGRGEAIVTAFMFGLLARLRRFRHRRPGGARSRGRPPRDRPERPLGGRRRSAAGAGGRCAGRTAVGRRRRRREESPRRPRRGRRHRLRPEPGPHRACRQPSS